MKAIINFHGIGEAVREYEDGEEPYWISEKRFHQILNLIEQGGPDIGITFDDGNSSDFDIALPALKKRDLAATFFVLAGKIDQPGYLTAGQVGVIAGTEDMQVGSHGMDHVVWPEIDNGALERELSDSKKILEGICGHPVQSVGLPFGRYDRRVLGALRAHGYDVIYSSDGGAKLTGSVPVPRFSVRSDTDIEEITRLLSGASIIARAKSELRVFIKSLR